MYRAPLNEGEIALRDAGKALSKFLPVGWGFLTIFYQYHAPGYMTYLSTGKREDCIKLLEEYLGYLKSGKAPMKPQFEKDTSE